LSGKIILLNNAIEKATDKIKLSIYTGEDLKRHVFNLQMCNCRRWSNL